MNENIEKIHEKYLDKMSDFLKKKGLILDDKQIERQQKKNEKLLSNFLNWLKTKKKVTKQELEPYEMNIDTFLYDLPPVKLD